MLKNKKVIIKYIVLFIMFLCWNLLITDFSLDEQWDYGFVYNVSKGFLPYRDFSTIIPPLFCFLYAIPMFIFGHSILVLHVFNALVLLFMYYFLDKLLEDQSYLFLSFTLIIGRLLSPSYNLLLLVLYILLLYLEKNKKSDYLIGVVLGLCLLTKQSVGVFLLLPSLYYLKSDKTKIIKRLKGLLIPCSIFLVYLLVTKTFYDFLDLCIFGLFDFGNKNSNPFNFFMLIVLFLLGSMLYLLKKEKQENKIYLLYALCYLSISAPIFDLFHVANATLAYIIYLLISKHDEVKKKLPVNYKIIYLGAYIGTSIIFVINQSPIVWPNGIKNFEYRVINKRFVDYSKKFNNYLDNHKQYNFIFLNYEGYFFRIMRDERIYNYDMHLYGNHGYNGSEKMIENIKNAKKNTLIFINKQELKEEGQADREVINYVINNCDYFEKVGSFDTYIIK